MFARNSIARLTPFLQQTLATKTSISFGCRAYSVSQDKEKYFQLLVDSYRLQVDEEYKFQGRQQGIYAWISSAKRDVEDSNYPLNHFANYMNNLRERQILPSWWTEKDEQAVMNQAKSALFYTLERSDFMDSNGHETARLAEMKRFLKSLQ